MSAITAPAPRGTSPTSGGTAPAPGGPDTTAKKPGMSKGKKIGLLLFALWVLGLVFFIAVFGFKPHKAPEVASGAFTPTNEFKLDTWFAVGPVDFNKGVLYLLIAAGITLGLMFYVARRLQERPGRLQTAVEWFYSFTHDLAKGNLDGGMSKKYFPLIATIFVFILVSNLIGYIPLPVNSTDKFTIFGAHLPSSRSTRPTPTSPSP